MIAYTGETRARNLRERLSTAGVGLVVQRGRVQKAAFRKWPRWFWDNLAFTDWKEGSPFDFGAFIEDVLLMFRLPATERPDFAVLPDLVAQGAASLSLSLSWLKTFESAPFPWALAVQDGMRPSDVPWREPFSVLFVGGSTRWKLETAGEWSEEAHRQGKLLHIGRVGSARRVLWAQSIGADSIDSATPLWGERNWRIFEKAITSHSQAAWTWAAPRIGHGFQAKKEDTSSTNP